MGRVKGIACRVERLVLLQCSHRLPCLAFDFLNSIHHSSNLPTSPRLPHPSRLVKEVAAYEKEATEQEAKVAGMKAEGKDPYDIKKQEEVLQESYMMIPDSKARLAAAVEDLKAFLVRGGWRGACRVGWMDWTCVLEVELLIQPRGVWQGRGSTARQD